MIIVRYRTLIRSPCDSPSPPAVHPLPLHAHNHAVLAWSLHGGMFSTAVITSCLRSCYRRHVTGCDAMTMTPQKPLTPPVLLHITLFIQLCYTLSFSLSYSRSCSRFLSSLRSFMLSVSTSTRCHDFSLSIHPYTFYMFCNPIRYTHAACTPIRPREPSIR